MYKIKYGSSIISYEIIKSKRRKTSEITVGRDGVIVRTPHTKSPRDAKKMVEQKAQWIFKKQLYYARQKPQALKEKFAIGSTLSFKGKDYMIKIIPNKKQTTKLSKGFLEFHITQKRHTKNQIREMYQEWLKKKAEPYFAKLVDKYSSIVGAKPSKIIIKNLKGRWGSTTERREINLNANIMKAPIQVINYVILHEICHLKIKEHSFHFWDMISRHMPNYEDQKRWLELNNVIVS